MPERIGIFGGTFDPPHLGHQALATHARSQLDLVRLLWMLTPDPPHKRGRRITPVEHRLAMVELALMDMPGCELSRIELDRPGPHYALNTVKLVGVQYPEAELVYLMGGDSLHDLPDWHKPAELLAALRFLAVMRRPGADFDLPALEQVLPGITAKIHFVEAPLLKISGSEIRRRAAFGKPFNEFVLPSVYDYIIDHRLYSHK